MRPHVLSGTLTMHYSERVGPEWLASCERRRLDVITAASMLPVAVPLGITASALLAYELGEAPFMSQERIGSYPETKFSVPKLKTLSGPVTNGLSARGFDHDRAGPIAKRVRQLHLDEMPQLYSVLRGDMSIIGPRPLTPVEFEQTMDILSSDEQSQFLEARRQARPGIVWPGSEQQHTRGKDVELYEKAHLTIDYSATASMRSDVELITKTLGAVISSNRRQLARKSSES